MARAGEILELAARIAVAMPRNLHFLGKNSEGNYTLDSKIVEAVPIGKIKITELDFEDFGHRKARRAIRREITTAALAEPAYRTVNAVYIMRKNGTMEKGEDKTWYQPMMIKYE